MTCPGPFESSMRFALDGLLVVMLTARSKKTDEQFVQTTINSELK